MRHPKGVVSLSMLAFSAAPTATAQTDGAELFAPGVVSIAGHDDLTPTFSPDGMRLVFVRRSEGGTFTLVESHRTAKGWGPPEPLPFSGAHDDQAPFFAPDGARLYFQSRRPLDPDRPRAENAPRDDSLWVVAIGGAGWGTPQPLGFPVRRSPPADGGEPFQGREMAPSVDAEGALYYWSHLPGHGHGGSDLYRARAGRGGYAEPENLGPVINSPHYETHPWIAPDGSFLIWSCDGCPDALGASDLYVSRRAADGWSEPVNLGPAVNSAAYDFGATLAPDGRSLLFSSNRRLGDDGSGEQNIFVIDVERVPALAFLEEKAAGPASPEAGIAEAGSPSRDQRATGSNATVEYLANEGVLITAGARSVLIDALFGEGLPDYPVVPPATRDSLEGAVGRFADIDLVLVTHLHHDHFDPAAVARHLEANGSAILVAPGDAVDALGEEIDVSGAGAIADRIRSLTMAPGELAKLDIEGTEILALGLAHAGIGHVGYRVRLPGVGVLHLGDAQPKPSDLAPLLTAGDPPDVALVPFWILTGPEGPGLVEAMEAGCVAAFHLERNGGDVAARLARWVPTAMVLDEPGERLAGRCDRPGAAP